MLSAVAHYGNQFIECLKKDGRHGTYFEYEGYLELENCKTIEDFRKFIAKTEFRDVVVEENVAKTYENFKKVDEAYYSRQTVSYIFGPYTGSWPAPGLKTPKEIHPPLLKLKAKAYLTIFTELWGLALKSIRFFFRLFRRKSS